MYKTVLIAFIFLYASSVYAHKIDLVKVDKSDRVMLLMSSNKIVKKYAIALGKNLQGHKQEEGDKKTPEGLYTLDYKKEDSSFYRAMHISYPNKEDVRNAEMRGVNPGGLIMVHGQPNGLYFFSFILQKFNWTNGCIALNNRDMDEFMDLVSVGTQIYIE